MVFKYWLPSHTSGKKNVKLGHKADPLAQAPETTQFCRRNLKGAQYS